MTFSAGQLHSCASLLHLVSSSKLAAAAVEESSHVILVRPAPELLNMSIRCGWIMIDGEGMLAPSERGRQLLGMDRFELRMREQMRDIITIGRPAWGKMIMHGRYEAERNVPSDVGQCLREAGLLAADPPADVVGWWDDIGGLVRGVRSASLLKVGRDGERRTLSFEYQRTGKRPHWQALESSFSGFDVLSVRSSTDATQLQIEVKATEQNLGQAALYLTVNEWRMAQVARAYQFHLWILNSHPRLAILELPEIEPHVPRDQGRGTWESVRIPFSTFAERFNPAPPIMG